MSTGDFNYIHLSGNYNYIEARKNWCLIFDEYISEFGLPDGYARYLNLMTKACSLYVEAYNGKRHLLVNARLKEAEAKRAISGEEESINVTAARISKFMRMPIDIKKTTIAEWNSYLSIIKNG